MSIKYKLIKEQLLHPDIGAYTTYGIGVYDGKTQLRKISDISTDKHQVSKVCRVCNKLQLAPEHINEVISNLICL